MLWTAFYKRCASRLNSSLPYRLYNRNYSSKYEVTTENPQRMVAVFTCNICQHRSAKIFSKQAYNHGIVYVKCSGCDNLHLISDQLRWFSDKPVNIQDLLKERKKEAHQLVELARDAEADANEEKNVISESDVNLIREALAKVVAK